jgi:exonuclease III
MKILSWNCQGIGNPKTVRALRKLINYNQPDIIFLMETKLHNPSKTHIAKFAASYGFYNINCMCNGTRGRSGGLLLLWNDCTCHVDIMDMDFNYIDVSVTNINDNSKWRATGLYGYPQHQNKYLTCDLIKSLYTHDTIKNWIMFGDFNINLSSREKYGGNPIDNNITSLFRSTLTLCGLQDLGYEGDIFTWTNKNQGDQLIKARLDRFLATSEWINCYPNYTNHHLIRYKSDHSPIMLVFSAYFNTRNNSKIHKPFRYEQVWMRDMNHIQMVKKYWGQAQGPLHHKL